MPGGEALYSVSSFRSSNLLLHLNFAVEMAVVCAERRFAKLPQGVSALEGFGAGKSGGVGFGWAHRGHRQVAATAAWGRGRPLPDLCPRFPCLEGVFRVSPRWDAGGMQGEVSSQLCQSCPAPHLPRPEESGATEDPSHISPGGDNQYPPVPKDPVPFSLACFSTIISGHVSFRVSIGWYGCVSLEAAVAFANS